MIKTELKSKLEKTLDFLKLELSQIRTGRANPSLIEEIQVDAYDSKMTLKELGSITLIDPQNLSVIPWDKNLLQNIVKALRESEIKLNPVLEGDRIRVPVPLLTEERRIEFTKIVSTKVEEAKNSMRNIRHDAIKDVEDDFEKKLIGEDDKFRNKEEIDKLVKDFVEKSEELGNAKKSDLMTV